MSRAVSQVSPSAERDRREPAYLEVLGGDERVLCEGRPVAALEGDNLAAGPADLAVEVKRLPEVVDRVRAGLGADVDQDADVGDKNLAKGVKEPAVRVELLLITLFKAEEELDGHAVGVAGHNLELAVNPELGRVLVDMSRHRLTIDDVLGRPGLVAAELLDAGERPRVNLLPAVRDDANDDLLPALVVPRPALGLCAEIVDVLHDASERPEEELVVLVVLAQ